MENIIADRTINDNSQLVDLLAIIQFMGCDRI